MKNDRVSTLLLMDVFCKYWYLSSHGNMVFLRVNFSISITILFAPTISDSKFILLPTLLIILPFFELIAIARGRDLSQQQTVCLVDSVEIVSMHKPWVNTF